MHTRFLWPLAAMLGCRAEVADPLAEPSLAPPADLRLQVGNVVSGEDTRFAVYGLIPGETATFALSYVGEGAGPCPSACLDILEPQRFASAVADASGMASVFREIPSPPLGETVWVQAIAGARANAGASDVERRTFQRTPPLPVRPCNPAGHRDAPFTVNDSHIEGDTLFLDVGYSGGCAEHEVTVCWDGAFAESFPVQTSLAVVHNDHFDPCEAWLSETWRIDLTRVHRAYGGLYDGEGQMWLHADAETLFWEF